jgi:hypothetical protein
MRDRIHLRRIDVVWADGIREPNWTRDYARSSGTKCCLIMRAGVFANLFGEAHHDELVETDAVSFRYSRSLLMKAFRHP